MLYILSMDIIMFREYCLSKPGVTEDTPFDEVTLCFRVGGKIFAITDIDSFESVNLKCDPERAVELREQHPGILPGYHMNKKHWNTVLCDGSVPQKLILELTDHSYQLIRDSLPKKVQSNLHS
jgi:predicted DNA-binding protein (MmcQ/YjbR family)